MFGINYIEPKYHTVPYKAEDVIRIKDRWQQFLYLKNGARPTDIYVTGDDLVMVFYKEETKSLYELYRQRKLN